MKKRSSFLLVVLALLLTLVWSSVVSAQSNWFRSGRVLDTTSTSGPDITFVNAFNQKSNASGHNIYLVIVDASLLVNERYTDTVVADMMRGTYGNTYGIGGWMPSDVVAIAIAPYVTQGQPAYDYAVSTLVYNGKYAKLGEQTLPGHSDSVGLEIAQQIDGGVSGGNWQQAVLTGLDSIVSGANALGLGPVAAAQAPVVAQPPIVVIVPTAVPQVAATPLPPVIQQPVDLTGLWETLKGLIIIIVIAGSFGIIIVLLVRRNRSIVLARAAQSSAKLQKTQCSSLLNAITDELKDYAGIELIRGSVSDGMLNRLQDRLSAIRRGVENASEKFTQLSRSVNDPDAPNLSKEEYETIGSTFGDLLPTLEQLSEQLRGLSADTDNLRMRAETAPGDVRASQDTLNETQTIVSALTAKGFFCKQALGLLSQAAATLQQAQKHLDAKDFDLMDQVLEQVQELVKQAADSAAHEEARQQDLQAEVGMDRQEIVTVRQHIQDGQTALGQMQVEFVPSAYADVAGNIQAATDSLAEVEDILRDVEAMIAMDRQDWEAADARLDDAHKGIQFAGLQITSILNLKQRLEEARKNAGTLVEQASTDVQDASAFLQTHDTDLDESYEAALLEANVLVKQTVALYAGPQPDYLQIVESARRASTKVKSILSQMQGDVQKMQRAKSDAETNLREAKQAIEAADDYIDDHRSDVESSARNSLASAKDSYDDAKRAYAEAETMEDEHEKQKLATYETASRHADTAEEDAKKALSKAKQNVSDNQPTYTSMNSYGSTWSTPSVSTRPETGSSSSHTSIWQPSTRPSQSSSSPSISRPSSRPSISASSSRPSVRASVAPTSSRPSRR